MIHSRFAILFSAKFNAIAGVLLFLSTQACFAYDEQKYQALMKAAKHHLKMMELEKAIDDYTAAIKANPNNYLTYQLRSEVRRDLNLFPEGIADLTHAIALNPKDAGLYRDRGYLYFKNYNYKEAIADYTKAISIDPNDGGAYRFRGRNYACLKQYKNAAADYKKSLQLKSKTTSRLEVETRGILGDLYVKCNQLNEALEQFNILIERFPHVSRGFYGRAEVYKLLCKTDLSKKDIEKAHELDYEMDPALRKMH